MVIYPHVDTPLLWMLWKPITYYPHGYKGTGSLNLEYMFRQTFDQELYLPNEIHHFLA